GGARLGAELAQETGQQPGLVRCPHFAEIGDLGLQVHAEPAYAAGKKSMGLLTVSGSTSAALKRIRRTRATIFFSSSSSLSSLDTTRTLDTSPDGRMVNSSTTLPASSGWSRSARP